MSYPLCYAWIGRNRQVRTTKCHLWLWICWSWLITIFWDALISQEYVVEDVDGEMTGSDWLPPPLPAEHVQQLKTLGLLWNEMGQFSFFPEEHLLKAWNWPYAFAAQLHFFTLDQESPIHIAHKYITAYAFLLYFRMASFCLIRVRKWERIWMPRTKTDKKGKKKKKKYIIICF